MRKLVIYPSGDVYFEDEGASMRPLLQTNPREIDITDATGDEVELILHNKHNKTLLDNVEQRIQQRSKENKKK